MARHAPAAALAAGFGIADPDRCAEAVGAVAAAYFPGADEPARRAADAATRSLLDMLAGAGTDTAVARITVMVQGCDATASLIVAALDLLPELAADCSADDLLAQTVHRRPPVRAIRRVALAPAELGGRSIAAGDRVTCDVGAVRRDAPDGAVPDTAASDTAVPDTGQPAENRPGGGQPANWPGGGQAAGDVPAAAALTFGYGLRPCPGPEHALALAAGVIDAVRAVTW